MSIFNDIAGKTNIEYWNLARKVSPTFASHTAEGTAELFTERGFESITRNDINTLNDFFNLSMRVVFQKLSVSTAKNPIGDKILERYSTPNGGYIQRMSIESVKPISPAYKDLKDGDSPDPFIVRKGKMKERFFRQNFDYQNLITIQDWQAKQIFVNSNGMGEFLAGIFQAMSNGYVIQEYVNTLECLNSAINPTKYPLQESQKITITVEDKDNLSNADLTTMILNLKDLVSSMTIVAQSDAYNSYKFMTSVNTEDLVILMRPQLKNLMSTNLLSGAIHPEQLTLPCEVVEVENFGGIKYYKEAAHTNLLYPVYNKLGEQIGWNTEDDAETVEVELGKAFPLDPNEDVLCVVMQKGMMFTTTQNPYTVSTIRNPRGLYDNYWASSPNNGIAFDPIYNLVKVSVDEG